MKRLFFIPIVLFASVAWGNPGCMMMSGSAGGVACDDCSGTLAYSHHAENNDDATTSANGTCGCSDSVTYKSWDLTTGATSAEYSTTQKYDGLYSVYIDAVGDEVSVTETDWLDLTEVGTWSAWVYATPNDDNLFYIGIDATHYVRVRYNTPENFFSMQINDGDGQESATTTATITPNTWGLIEVSWDLSIGAGSNKLKARINGGSWEGSSTLQTTDIGISNNAEYNIIGGNNNSQVGYYDAPSFTEAYTGD